DLLDVGGLLLCQTRDLSQLFLQGRILLKLVGKFLQEDWKLLSDAFERRIVGLVGGSRQFPIAVGVGSSQEITNSPAGQHAEHPRQKTNDVAAHKFCQPLRRRREWPPDRTGITRANAP